MRNQQQDFSRSHQQSNKDINDNKYNKEFIEQLKLYSNLNKFTSKNSMI